MPKNKDRININVNMKCFGEDRKCPICNKTFLATDEWIYKRNKKKLCSYSCMNEYDKREKAKQKPNRLEVRNAGICDDFKRGVPVDAIAEKHNLKIGTIEQIISNILFNGSVRALHIMQRT